MNIFVAGAGRVGRTLILLGQRSGHTISGCYNLTEEGSKITTNLLGITAQWGPHLNVPTSTDLLWITTSDAYIESTAQRIAAQNPQLGTMAWVHCSGALAAQVLRTAVPGAWSVAGAHPLQSFVDPAQAAQAAQTSAWFVEGEPDALSVVRTFLHSFGVIPRTLPAELRPLYHAAGVLASNAALALFDAACAAMAAVGMSRNEAVKALCPLWQGTLDNVAQKGLPAALTGPIARGDIHVVRAHLRALETHAPDLVGIYRELGIRTLQLANELGQANRDSLREIAQTLIPS